VYLIWYGMWQEADKQALRGFVQALQAATSPSARPNYQRILAAKKNAQRSPGRKLSQGAQPRGCTSTALGCTGESPHRRGLKGKGKSTKGDSGSSSESQPLDPESPTKGAPKPQVYTLRQWWTTTGQYTAKYRKRVAQYVKLEQEHAFPSYLPGARPEPDPVHHPVSSPGSHESFGGSLPLDPHGVYIVLTAPEIRQQYFRSSSCAYHGFTASGLLQTPQSPCRVIPVAYKPWRGPQVAIAWVGNPSKQCPGYCGFPFIAPAFVPASFAEASEAPQWASNHRFHDLRPGPRALRVLH